MAGNISQELIAKVRTLPPMPIVSRKLIAAMQQETCSTAEISRILSSDQALASQVLKLVNSSFYGLSGKVSTVSHAVVILGFSAVRSLAIGLGVANGIQAVAKDHDQIAFWKHSVAAAASARVLAEAVGQPDAEEAFVAGLLHDLGALLMEIVVGAPAYRQAVKNVGDIIAVEDEAFGINHAKAGQILLRHWRLPESLCHSIRFHHHAEAYRSDTTKLTAFVAAGDQLTGALGVPSDRIDSPARLFELTAFLGVSLQQTEELLNRIERAIEDTYVFLALAGVAPPPAAVTADKGRRFVVLGGNTERTGWIRGLMHRGGFQPVPVADFLAKPGLAAEIDLVVVDGTSMSRENIQRLRPVLTITGARIVCYGESCPDLVAAVGRPLPVLPALFGTTDLEEIIGVRLAV